MSMVGSATRADRRACAALIRDGSRSFHAASYLLPSRLRDAAFALYAFCRLGDDEIDRGGGHARLAALRGRLDRVFAGRPDGTSVERALADAIAAFDLPRAPFEALIEGFAWDLEGRRYAGLEDVLDYAARVAGSVGALMACLMGVRSPAMLARACDLGLAMQLTNIARDVAEDAALGRVYLPLDWLREEGLDADDFLTSPRSCPAVTRSVARLLESAHALYARADAGLAALPREARFAMVAARLLYCEIGRELTRRGGDPFMGRATTSSQRKALLLAQAVIWRGGSVQSLSAPAERATRFLVEACATSAAASAASHAVERFMDMLLRLEARDRAGAMA